MRLAHEGRHQCDQKQRDEPWRKQPQAGGKAQDGDQILRLAEHLAEQGHPPHGEPAGAVEPVLQFAVFEVFEIELGGMLHEPDAGIGVEPIGEERIDEGDDPAEDIGGDGRARIQGRAAK